MDVIFLAFANSSSEPLDTLQEEDQKLYELLSPQMMDQRFVVHRESFATVDNITKYLTKFRKDIRLFLYSGHAGRDKLLIDDEEARAEGIAYLLSQCPNLQLVFLNGCSTKGQVKKLLELGIPAVLATSAPIDDRKATDFSIQFFASLCDQNSIEESFESAKGRILTSADIEIPTHGGLVVWGDIPDDSFWGMYTKAEESDVLNWKLPEESQREIVIRGASNRYGGADIPINQKLTQELFEVLSQHSKKLKMLRMLAEDDEDGEIVDIREIRGAIMDSLPSLLAEQIRKLFAATPESQSSGMDQIGSERLEQLVKTYSSFVELLAFSMLAQLWDVKFADPQLELPQETIELLKQYFTLDSKQQTTYNYNILIGGIREFFDANNVTYFINEIHEVKEAFDSDQTLVDAVNFMEEMKVTLAEHGQVGANDIENFCVAGEEHLATILHHVGFCAKYKLATIKDIGLIKKRNRNPQYVHSLVNLDTVTRGYLDQEEIFEEFTDSRSVVFFKSRKSVKEFLNLSPFVIDENAFTGDDKTKLFYFTNYDSKAHKLNFRFAYNRDDVLQVSAQKYPEILEQFDEFCQLIFGKSLQEL